MNRLNKGIKKLNLSIIVFLVAILVFAYLFSSYFYHSQEKIPIIPKEITPSSIASKPIYDDSKKIINTAGYFIKCKSPLTKEQIAILRNSRVRVLYSTSVQGLYYALIEEDSVDTIKNFDFVEEIYYPPLKIQNQSEK